MSYFFKRKIRTKPSILSNLLKLYNYYVVYVFSLVSLWFILYRYDLFILSCTIRPTKYENFYNVTRLLFDDKETFYDNKIIYELSKADFSRCPLCNFQKDKNGTSTKRDLAIAVLYGTKTYNVINWVRTLRSTGCKCSILFFHEPNYIYHFGVMAKKMLNDCGVVWWSLKKILLTTGWLLMAQQLVFLLYNLFLKHMETTLTE